MSVFRKHFVVSWDDREPVHIITTARDLAEADEYTDNKVMTMFAMVHSALKRNGHDVPDFEKFLEIVDYASPSQPEEETDVNPTEPKAYSGEQSP